MGPEAATAALVLGGTTGMQIAGQQAQKREQRRILNRALDNTQRTQQQGAQMLLDEARKIAPANRQQALADQEAASYAQSQKDLGGVMNPGTGGAIIDTAGSAGNVSKDFVRSSADKAITEGSRLMAVAREAAKVRAPGQVLAKEGQGVADLTGRLNSMYGSNRNMANAAELDSQQVDEPWYGKLGKIAQQAAMIYMTAGAGAPAAGSSSFALPSAGASLGESATPSFWSQAGSRIRFGG